MQSNSANYIVMGHKTSIAKSKKAGRPCGKCYELFNFNTSPTPRSRETKHGNYRLEHYFFRCYNDGSYEFEFQEGWFAGSHNDGGTAFNEIPEEWLSGTWEEFVDKFSAAYPDNEYFITRYELLNDDKLKAFLGF